jgi:hypothetical protein
MTDSPISTRELDWYDLETKMRELLIDSLEPLIENSRKQKETILDMTKTIDKQAKQIDSLEMAVFKRKTEATMFEEIENRLAEIEGNRRKDNIRTDQELTGIREGMKSFQFSLNNNSESMKRMEFMYDKLTEEMQEFRNILKEYQTYTVQQFTRLSDDFKKTNETYMDFVRKNEERAIQAINKGHTNQIEISNLKEIVEIARKEVFDGQTEIRNFRDNKLEVDAFEKDQEKTRQELDKVYRELYKIKDEFSVRDAFVDKFVPMRTVIYISDYVHSFIPENLKKKLVDFEQILFREINSLSLNDEGIDARTTVANRVLEEMKRVEQRKTNVMAEKAQKKPTKQNSAELTSVPVESPEIVKNMSFEQPVEVISKTPDPNSSFNKELYDQDMKMLENLYREFRQYQDEVSKRLEFIKKDFRSSEDNSSLYMNELLSEIDNIKKLTHKQKGDIIVELTNSNKEITELQEDMVNLGEAISAMAQMVACLVENAQIEQALDSQDEEDRKSLAATYEKELNSEFAAGKHLNKFTPVEPGVGTALPSGILSFQKKCLSCQGATNAVLTGVKTAIMYKPTPLFYRNKKYQRNELIYLKGRMLRNCWDAVSSQLPWKKQEFEQVIKESVKKSSTNLAVSPNSSLRHETPSRESLPLLVSPALTTPGGLRPPPRRMRPGTTNQANL